MAHTQSLFKATGGSPKRKSGFHQDFIYWQHFDRTEELFTTWKALSSVEAAPGAICFIAGFHRWEHLHPDNFAEQDPDPIIVGLKVPETEKWSECMAVMPTGAASFNHQRTIHDSHPNLSDQLRRRITIYLCTEKFHLVHENS